MSAPMFASLLQRPSRPVRADGPGDDDEDETPIGDPGDDEDFDDDEEEDDEDDTLWARATARPVSRARTPAPRATARLVGRARTPMR